MGRWQEFLFSLEFSNKDYKEASAIEKASIQPWWPWNNKPPIIRSETAFLKRYYEDIKKSRWLERWVRFINDRQPRSQYLNVEIGAEAFNFLTTVNAAVGETKQGADGGDEAAIRARSYKAMVPFIKRSMEICARPDTGSRSKAKSNAKSKSKSNPELRTEHLFFIYHPNLEEEKLDSLLPKGAYQYLISGVSDNLNALVLWMRFLHMELLRREEIIRTEKPQWFTSYKPRKFRFHLLIPSYYELVIKAQLQFPRDLESLTIHGQMGDNQGDIVSNIWLNLPDSNRTPRPELNGIGNLNKLRLPHDPDWILSMPGFTRPIIDQWFGAETSALIVLGHDKTQMPQPRPREDDKGVFSMINYNE